MYMMCSNDSNNLVNVTPLVQKRICHREQMLLSFIQFEYQYLHHWILRREFQYLIDYVCRPVRYYQLGKSNLSDPDRNISLGIDTTGVD